jgi:hypothetical protein
MIRTISEALILTLLPSKQSRKPRRDFVAVVAVIATSFLAINYVQEPHPDTPPGIVILAQYFLKSHGI